ncbi:CPBP family intramembrane glutamic endopeptidase [Verrucomicrobiota bacterium sgz303538]
MPTDISSLLGLLVLIATPIAFVFYGRLIARLRREGGRVRTDWVNSPDIAMALPLGGALAGLAISGLAQASKKASELRPDQVVPGMVFLIVLAGGIAVFLTVRRLSLVSILAPQKLSPPRAVGRGVLMLLAAIPVVLIFSLASVAFLQEQAKEQELVKLFSDVSRQGDMATVIKILIAGVVVAPLCEELIFRGYFYPVAKRFLGPVAGALLTALLFSISHVNLASLPSLTVLALCFIVAYESTGSLLVPITMHACFNAANLFLLYLAAQGRV